jgi:hypothetical protein
MNEMGRGAANRPNEGTGIFSWAFYLFGAVVTSLTFAYLMQFFVGPHWGEQFLRGWIDPSLNLVAIPLVGAVLGLVLMVLLNLSYVLLRGRTRK